MLSGFISRSCLLGAFILAPGLAFGQGTTAFPDHLYGEANLLATQAAGDGKKSPHTAFRNRVPRTETRR